jgi:hypothetical protein
MGTRMKFPALLIPRPWITSSRSRS